MSPAKFWSAALLAALLTAGCNCGGDVGPGDGDGGTGGNGSDGGVNGDGGTGGNNGSDAGTNLPFPKEEACETLSDEASLTKKPVDIIVVIDNSGSMTEEAQAVENNINANFGQIIEQSGIDYRVIMIAAHGSASGDQSVCIRAPLSGTNCSPIPAAPVNGARFFQYDTEIGSTNSLTKLISTYATTDIHNFAPGGWKTWLRPNSIKTFIEITDDESSITADSFEQQLFALSPAGTFGTATDRQYVFHSIIGIVPNSPATDAWKPTDPKKNAMCDTAADPGARYEDLSIRTGGLRFPVCETSSYDAVFKAAAQDVIESATIACDFTPAPLPEGQVYSEAYIEYTPGIGGAAELFLEVPDSASCSATGFTRDEMTGRITLCPAACDKVKGDETAQLNVLYACGAVIN